MPASPSNADTPPLSVRYGQWAIVAGASEGLGAAFAEQLAARGVHCHLVARREALIAALAADLRTRYGVQTAYQVLDLERVDAAEALDRATAMHDVGLVVYNAGADDSAVKFLAQPLEKCRSLVRRNVITLMETVHRFGERMARNRRGAFILIGSDAALGGGSRVCMYTATKGFGINFAESLWAELKPLGIDVLHLVIGAIDTPVLRRSLQDHGIPVESVQPAVPAELARLLLDNIANGPDLIYWPHDRDGARELENRRRDRVLETGEILKAFWGPE